LIKNALLIIDVQQAFIDGKIIPPVFQATQLISNINNLIRKARESNSHIIFIKHNGPEGTGHPVEKNSDGNKIYSGLNRQDNDVIIEKTTPDSFYNTGLQNYLCKNQIMDLVICGIQTEICVDTTCRSAFSKNYKIILASDTHSTWNTDNINAKQIITHHNNIFGNWFGDLKEEKEINLQIV